MINDSGTIPFIERRLKPRMKCNYQALVKGRDDSGREFKEGGRVINLSRSGIFMLLNRIIPENCEISVRIVLPTGNLEFGSTQLTTSGTVVRDETLGDGVFGVAVKFQHFRIL